MLYFARAGDHIKIGFSEDPEKRLRTLNTANPYPVELLLTVPGDMNDEHELHAKFAEFRTSGEWFKAHPALVDYINERGETRNDALTLAETVLKRRKQAGLSRARLSLLSGVSATAIYDVEHGKESVQLKTLMEMCNVLNLKLTLLPG